MTDKLMANALREAEGFDSVKQPAHYCQGRKIQPIDVVNDWELSFCLGNVLKYLARYNRKGSPVQDLKKARQYLSMEIERLEKNLPCEDESCG